MSNISSFTVSDLPAISDISHDDLLMVSDYDRGKCYTRKMTLSALYGDIVDDSIVSAAVQDSSKALGRAIDAKLSSAVKEEVQRQVLADLSAKVLQIIFDNCDVVWDYLDGVVDGQNTITC